MTKDEREALEYKWVTTFTYQQLEEHIQGIVDSMPDKQQLAHDEGDWLFEDLILAEMQPHQSVNICFDDKSYTII